MSTAQQDAIAKASDVKLKVAQYGQTVVVVRPEYTDSTGTLQPLSTVTYTCLIYEPRVAFPNGMLEVGMLNHGSSNNHQVVLFDGSASIKETDLIQFWNAEWVCTQLTPLILSDVTVAYQANVTRQRSL